MTEYVGGHFITEPTANIAKIFRSLMVRSASSSWHPCVWTSVCEQSKEDILAIIIFAHVHGMQLMYQVRMHLGKQTQKRVC